MRHTESVGQWVRISGSPDERKAFEYIESELRAHGYHVTIYESDALIGYPLESRLEMTHPFSKAFVCNGYSLSPSTSDAGVTGELIYVGSGLAGSYDDLDARKKIAVSDGLAMPEKALAAQMAGAIAQIHISGAQIHEMCISPVWGSPTPATKDLLPSVPAVSVSQEDGDTIKEALKTGTVLMNLYTQPFRGWRKIPTLIADLPTNHQGEYVLFSGHVDSWHYGVMDNGTANATQLEVARLLAERADELRRGVRFAFWSGHSHGRYAGSAWYADEFWHDIHDNCVCHVNIDSVGAVGATVLEEAPTMAETYGFAKRILKETTGVDLEYRRISRSSDQSFWGHGIPSLFGTFSEQELDATPAAKAQSQLLGASGRGGGLGWWWHTTEDLLDKIDPDNLKRDAQVYAEALWQLTTDEYLPFSFADAADEMAEALKSYQTTEALSFERTIGLARALAVELREIESSTAFTAEQSNQLCMDLSRILIPINYTRTGPFEQDLALSSRSVPGLSDATKLQNLNPTSDEHHHLKTQLLRERNRVEHGLKQAIAKVEALK
jgi:Iap family predicted aminopeptidase